MALTFPRDLRFEAFLGPTLGWTDLTQYLRQVDPVIVKRGTASEQSSPTPSNLTCGLMNPNGLFTPGNPTSAYAGRMRTYTQVRLPLVVVRDALTNRTVSNGWGSAQTGEAWSLNGAAANFSVSASGGVQAVQVANQFLVAYSADDYLNSDQTVTVSVLPSVNVTGAPVEPACPVARYQAGTGEHYFARVTIQTDQSVKVTIAHSSAGDLVTPVTVTGLAHVGTNKLSVRLACEAQTLHAKVWDAANPEPLGWHVGAHDSRLFVPGRLGIRSGVAASNTNTMPVNFTYTNYQARLLRFSGEVVDLKPKWDTAHKVKYLVLEAAGQSRRLGSGTSPTNSTMRRAMKVASPQPFAYWPMEDPANSDLVTSGIGGPPMTYDNFPGRPQFAASTDFVCSAPALKLNNAVLRGTASDYALTGQNQFRFLLSIPAQGETAASGFALAELYCTGSAARWQIIYTNGAQGELALNAFTAAGASLFGTGAISMGIHGVPKRVSLELTETGGNINWNFSVIDLNGAAGGTSGTLNTNDVQRVTGFAFNGGPAFKDTAISHAYAQPVVNGTGDLLADLIGRNGELAGTRAGRLGVENGITFDYVGAQSDTMPMGVQGYDTILNLFQACADTDQGTLYEPCYVCGLAMRFRRSLSQTAAVTLDYSAGEVHASPPLEPALGDRFVQNSIRVRRTTGGEYLAEQTSGPMNVNDPGTDPDAIGRREGSATLNLNAASALRGAGEWMKHVRASPELRFPTVTTYLRKLSQAQQAAVLCLNIGDRVVVTNLQQADVYRSLDQLARGYTETFRDAMEHQIALNTSPARPYAMGTWAGTSASRWDSSDSTLSAAIATTGALSATVATTTVPWTTDPAYYPLTIDIEGELITVSSVSGTTSPQTFTFSQRAVNGAAMTHPINAKVRLADPNYWDI